VEFDVLDEGDGFPDSFLPVAFEPFRRGDTHHEGAGLGLALVDAVARAHGGNATAKNAPGTGASVRLALHTLPPQGAPGDDHRH
jgi:signal transduction histidine kinase